MKSIQIILKLSIEISNSQIIDLISNILSNILIIKTGDPGRAPSAWFALFFFGKYVENHKQSIESAKIIRQQLKNTRKQ